MRYSERQTIFDLHGLGFQINCTSKIPLCYMKNIYQPDRALLYYLSLCCDSAPKQQLAICIEVKYVVLIKSI